MIDELVSKRDELQIAYDLSGCPKDKAKYNRAVRELQNYIEENNIQYEFVVDTMKQDESGIGRWKSKEKLLTDADINDDYTFDTYFDRFEE